MVGWQSIGMVKWFILNKSIVLFAFYFLTVFNHWVNRNSRRTEKKKVPGRYIYNHLKTGKHFSCLIWVSDIVLP